MPPGPFTLAQLAQAAGVSIDDVRAYRDGGLLQPARRRSGRSSDSAYHQEHVDRLRFIGRALGYGFSLDAIAQFVEPSGLLTCKDVHAIGTRDLENLRRRAEPEAKVAAAFENLLSKCPQTGGRRGCPVLAAFADKTARPQKGWTRFRGARRWLPR
jgi:MerR family transcriptional regulator, mercuric resistance operon regulatory protein